MDSDSFTVEQRDSVGIYRVRPGVPPSDMMDIMKQVAAADPPARRLWILSGVALYDPQAIRHMATLARRLWPKPCRVAYVATDDISFGTGRMYEVHRHEDFYTTRIFRDEEEALAWVTAEEVPS